MSSDRAARSSMVMMYQDESIETRTSRLELTLDSRLAASATIALASMGIDDVFNELVEKGVYKSREVTDRGMLDVMSQLKLNGWRMAGSNAYLHGDNSIIRTFYFEQDAPPASPVSPPSSARFTQDRIIPTGDWSERVKSISAIKPQFVPSGKAPTPSPSSVEAIEPMSKSTASTTIERPVMESKRRPTRAMKFSEMGEINTIKSMDLLAETNEGEAVPETSKKAPASDSTPSKPANAPLAISTTPEGSAAPSTSSTTSTTTSTTVTPRRVSAVSGFAKSFLKSRAASVTANKTAASAAAHSTTETAPAPTPIPAKEAPEEGSSTLRKQESNTGSAVVASAESNVAVTAMPTPAPHFSSTASVGGSIIGPPAGSSPAGPPPPVPKSEAPAPAVVAPVAPPAIARAPPVADIPALIAPVPPPAAATPTPPPAPPQPPKEHTRPPPPRPTAAPEAVASPPPPGSSPPPPPPRKSVVQGAPPPPPMLSAVVPVPPPPIPSTSSESVDSVAFANEDAESSEATDTNGPDASRPISLSSSERNQRMIAKYKEEDERRRQAALEDEARMTPEQLNAKRQQEAEAAEREKMKMAHFSAMGKSFSSSAGGRSPMVLGSPGRGRGAPPPPPPR